MNPILGLAFVLIVFNIWMKRRINRKIKKSRNEPHWREQMRTEGYEEEIERLKIKYMTEEVGQDVEEQDEEGQDEEG